MLGSDQFNSEMDLLPLPSGSNFRLVTYLRDRAATDRKIIMAIHSLDTVVSLMTDAVVVCIDDEDGDFYAQLLSYHNTPVSF